MKTLSKLSLVLCFALLGAAFWHPAFAATTAVVGNGTPASCTETALATALAAGGDITFNCGDAPHTITLSTAQDIGLNTNVNGGGRITLSGGNITRVFEIAAEAHVTLHRLAINDAPNTASAVFNSGVLTVTQSSFRNNLRTALYNAGGTVTIAGSTFTANAGSNGGAVTNENAGTTSISGSTFISNTSASNAGAFYNSSLSTASIRDSVFRENEAVSDGGAIFNSLTMTIENIIVEDNTAGRGGGIYNGGTMLMRDSRISSNAATTNAGGGIAHLNLTNDSTSDLTLLSVTLDGNESKQDGGGLSFNDPESDLNLTNVTIYSNTANTIGGGGLFVKSGNATLTNVTLNDNESLANDGDGIENSDDLPGTIALRNTLVIGGGCDVAVTDNGGNLEFPGTSCGGGFANADPELGDLADNGGWTPTHAIAEEGPGRDAGTNTNCPATDQRGVLRPQTGTCDIGAFEWGALPILDSISPTSTLALSPTFTLVINGSNFIPGPSGTEVLWNGTVLQTTYVSGTELHAIVPDTLIVAGGTATVTVQTLVIDGGVSDASRVFTIIKRDQTITFDELADRGFEPASFEIDASASSELPVTLSAAGVCTVAGETVTLTGEEGTCTITAQQAGNASYNPAPDVVRSFTVSDPELNFLPLVQK